MRVLCPKCGAATPISPGAAGPKILCWQCDEEIALAKRVDSAAGIHAQLNTACDKQWFMDRYGDWWEVMWVLSSCGLAG